MARFLSLLLRRSFSSSISRAILAATFLLLLFLMMSKTSKKKVLPVEYLQNLRTFEEQKEDKLKHDREEETMGKIQKKEELKIQEKEQKIREKEEQELLDARLLEDKHQEQLQEEQKQREKQQQQQQLQPQLNPQQTAQQPGSSLTKESESRVLIQLHQHEFKPTVIQVPSSQGISQSVENTIDETNAKDSFRTKVPNANLLNAEQKLAEVSSVLKRQPASQQLPLASVKSKDSAVKVEEPAAKPVPIKKRKSNKKNTRAVCGMKTICADGEFGYSILSGGSKTDFPVICVDDAEVLSKAKSNAGRGINVAIFDTEKEKVASTRTFDTYSESELLHNFLRNEVNTDKILLFATFDDASNALKDMPKNWLKKYGSSKINEMKFRGSWVMIGQRGLDPKDGPEEVVNAAKNPDFASAAHIEGCFKTPEMGSLSVVGMCDGPDCFIEKGTKEVNCGLKTSCGLGEFPIYLSTGKENSEHVKICYNGAYYMEKGVNDAGRGFNIIVIDGETKNVTKRANFDTYSEDSTQLEIFLGVVSANDVVILVSFDDATTNLGSLAKAILKSFGAQKVDAFASKFRSAYYLVARPSGEIGTPGELLLESVSVSDGKAYAPPLEYRGCLRI